MAWHRPDDKPLSEPMMIKLPTHICVIRPQWFSYSKDVCLVNGKKNYALRSATFNYTFSSQVTSIFQFNFLVIRKLKHPTACYLTVKGKTYRNMTHNAWNKLVSLTPADKMAAVSQMIISDAFSWMNNFVFWLTFHWSFCAEALVQFFPRENRTN